VLRIEKVTGMVLNDKTIVDGLMVLLSLTIVLVYVTIPHFLCKSLVITKVVIKIDVQITQLITYYLYKCQIKIVKQIISHM